MLPLITRWTVGQNEGVTFPHGFCAAAARAGLKAQGDDVALICCASGAAAAGVFTTNQVAAPCVEWTRRVIAGGTVRAVVVNAGNANACNGPAGVEDNLAMARLAAESVNARPEEVCVASTGVIGHPLQLDLVSRGIAVSAASLGRGEERDAAVARAIMTTDTVPKYAAVELESDLWQGAVRLGGMCKGSGMIAPNMATMLAYITTDAAAPADLLQRALERAVAVSFNSITVDGDTSTNDMCLLLAGGNGPAISDVEFEDFSEAVTRLCVTLAKKIARDGEGATKLIEVAVYGAATEQDARQIARTIAESPLVKTAIFGCDPNWGRILMAVGRAGPKIDANRVDVSIGPERVCCAGAAVPFNRETAHQHLRGDPVRILVDLNLGCGASTFWTCEYS
ncbi:MAG TPA: bifunctional glutamate N-acetyltransferase/amino-acid acetyltransferase ArgJ, partial [Chthonomonadales bacterium]|nr:bifunctional glutamate N-acetyltransferase/amino-acid acetyltransferase ArgJ [Chthonomonadales bacterium]